MTNSVADPGKGPGAPAPNPPPPYFYTKLSPEGQKKIVFRDRPPYLRVWMTAQHIPPPLPPTCPLSEGLDPPMKVMGKRELGQRNDNGQRLCEFVI